MIIYKILGDCGPFNVERGALYFSGRIYSETDPPEQNLFRNTGGETVMRHGLYTPACFMVL